MNDAHGGRDAFDAIVVGARCAGSPTAMLLARAGYRVLLLDRAEFPSDTLSTHLVHQPGVAALGRWGLLERVADSGCPPLDRVLYRVGDVELTGCGRGVDGYRAGFAPRRFVLDAILLEGAVAAGVEFRERCTVTELLRDADGRVVGVTGTHRGGTFTERARLVVGADGMRSRVAELCDAPFTSRKPTLTCAYYAYWDDLPACLELYERPGAWVAAVPTNAGATLVLAYFPQARFDAVRRDAEAAHIEQVRSTAPELYDRIAGRRPVERLRGTGDQRNFFRQAAGPGWALVGDAGHHKDSITARGISDAFYQAESLVRHIGDGLADPARLDEALDAFAADRDKALTGGFEATLSVAQLEVHEERLSLLRAVRQDEELTSIYFDLVAGVGSFESLYTPRLMALL
ncbi:FAD-dependent oxidoreductase [Streptomyces sp. 3MP-14]|uniref:FAD-dependent oxidoreductase n=1 Tax=Streptomyces mimosae TaxID=2586635 RepID=A0A5N5ZUU7_9ACTN|nr:MULTISPECIES: NAD(P)/FAD-dependent oxidoreductase [Streptomyces]KAB8159559.1 FAD-dependent oxidoreductase [Streptomyces mimosae]KAB8172837.1 FAD-dependent oxidoreductase [Streptomyces sp. 3MP-14]